MAHTDTSTDSSHALQEAERLLGVLEKQLPTLAAMDRAYKPLLPPLRSASKALRKLTGPRRSPSLPLTEVDEVLRHVQLAASQLKRRGPRGHSLTVLKALGHVEDLLKPLTRAPAPPPEPEPASPLLAPPLEDTGRLEPAPPELSPPQAPLPSSPQAPLPYDGSLSQPAPASTGWSVESLTLDSGERPLLEVPRAAPPPPASQPPSEEAEAPSADEAEPPAEPSRESLQDRRAQFTGTLLEHHLEQLSDHFETREAQLNSGKATGVGLAGLELSFLAHTDALRWLGPGVASLLAERLMSAEEAGPAFALTLPLLTLAGNDTAAVVERAAWELVPEAAAGLVKALRFAPHPGGLRLLERFTRPDAPSYLQAPALGLLVQYGSWDITRAQAALAVDDPEIVAAAARAVLASGQGALLDFLEALLHRELDPPADTEVLIAAAVLGSSAAIERVRARLATEAAPPAPLVRLLAACGGNQDEGLLWTLAQKKTPVAKVARWALARLGPAEAVARLRPLAEGDSASPEAVEGLRYLLGTKGSAPATGRVAGGQPWAVTAPLEILGNPAAASLEREWSFWELTARTGLHVPFEPRWPWTRQRHAAQVWQSTVERASRRLPQGAWLYRGRLLAKGDGT